jgi:hypothetical protein
MMLAYKGESYSGILTNLTQEGYYYNLTVR